jgi:hypothetical protein
MSKEAWPRDLRGFLLAIFQIDIVWKPTFEGEEPPF